MDRKEWMAKVRQLGHPDLEKFINSIKDSWPETLIDLVECLSIDHFYEVTLDAGQVIKFDRFYEPLNKQWVIVGYGDGGDRIELRISSMVSVRSIKKPG